MNPYSEETLTQEVLYLHSLWRQGPPRNPKPTHNHSSTSFPAAENRNPTNKRPTDPNNRKNKKKKPRPEPPHDTGLEWPCPETVQNQPSTSSGWPPIEPVSTPAVHPISSEERANFAVFQLQGKVCDAFRGFFARNADSGSDDEEEEEEEEDDGEIMESEEYKFFLKLFVENDELRGYYEKNSENGLFCCLVCGGMGKQKFGKRFKNCAGLVHHSISISRTKKKRAHRAFGQVICRVFGWDIDRLPTIVLKGEPLSRSLANSGDLKGQPEENHVDEKNEMVSVDENEQKLEEVKTTEDSTSNAKDLISGEKDDACKDNDVELQEENADNSISGMVESNVEMDTLPVFVQPEEIHVDEKNEVVSVDENEQKLEEVKTAEDPSFSNAKDLISGGNDDDCKDNDVELQEKNADNSISGMVESNAEMDTLPVSVLESILKACRESFAAFLTSMSDDDVNDNNLNDEDKIDEHEEFKFFLKLFTENESLRRYYENNYDDGEFSCLACEGKAQKKTLKSFKTCGRLLQHATSLGKNKRGEKPDQKPQVAKIWKMTTLAHRAYSLVVCKVLGWDIEKIPKVVLKGKPLGYSLTKSDSSKDKSVDNGDDNKDDIVKDGSTKVNEMQGVKETNSVKVDSKTMVRLV